MRQLDPSIVAERGLQFIAYGLMNDLGQKTHGDEHKMLREFGFKVVSLERVCLDINEVMVFFEELKKKRESLPHEIDGVVVIVNPSDIYEELGVTGKSPRGISALKFPLQEVTTVVEDIIVQVGRTGVLTPVAVLRPVAVGGVTVSRATLHNQDEVDRLDVMIGDTVVIGRAGDVIPDVVRTLPEFRDGDEKRFVVPERCPVCDGDVQLDDSGIIHRCVNPECYAQIRRGLYHFVSRSAFNIDGLGPKIIDRLLDEGLIQDAADIFSLKEGDLMPLENFQERSSSNLISEISKSREISLSRLIFALGIRGVGEETAHDLSMHLGTLDRLKDASKEELESVENIGPVVASSVHGWLRSGKSLDLLDRLVGSGITITGDKVEDRLKGKRFVLTGTMKALGRKEGEGRVRQLGGEVSSGVSSNIDYVVAGSNPGGKLQKAEKLGVQILTEEEFLKMIG